MSSTSSKALLVPFRRLLLYECIDRIGFLKLIFAALLRKYRG